MNKRENLKNAYYHLMKIKGSCGLETMNQLNISDLTLKQIEYITIMDTLDILTTSAIAQELNLSKPTVTEMVKKFVKLDCVYKVQCVNDRRISYIHLTEKGKIIANLETVKMEMLIDAMIERLDDDDIADLIRILNRL